MKSPRHPASGHGRRGLALRRASRGIRAAAGVARQFLRSAFAPTQRERDALCALLAALAAFAAIRSAAA